VLYGLADAIGRARTLEETLEEALSSLTTALGLERAAVLLADETGTMRVRAWRGLSDGYRELAAGHSPWPPDAEGPEPVLVPDVELEPELAPLRDRIVAEGVRALAFVPLVHRSRLLGTFMLSRGEPGEWSEREVRLTQAFATHIAAASERHRALDELEESRRRLAVVLRDVADGITVQAPDGRLVYANDTAARTLGFESGEALLAAPVEELTTAFELLDEEHRPLDVSGLPGRIALAEGRSSERLVLYRSRATGDERWSLVRATPLLDGDGRVEAAINVFHDLTERRRSEEAARFVAEAGVMLSSSLDVDVTLANVARLAVPRIADWCIVYMAEEDGAIRRLAIEHAGGRAAAVAEVLDRYPLDPDAEVGVPAVIRSGRTMLVPDLTAEGLMADVADPVGLAAELDQIELASYLCVPMVARGRTLGAIALMSGESGRRFGAGEAELAEQLAGRAGLAVDNARLFGDAERAAARERRRGEQLRRLSHAALLVSSTAGLEELLPVVVEQAREIVGAARAAVAVERAGGDPIRASRGDEAAAGTTLTASLAARDGTPLGTLELVAAEGGAFTVEDQAILVQLAQMTSVALEHHRLLDERTRALALLDTLVLTAPIGLAFVDAQLRFARINETLARINGLPVAAHLGRRPLEVRDGFEQVEEVLSQVLATGEPVLELEVASEGRHFVGSYYPVRAGGEVVGVGIIVVEVTEARRAAAERERLLRELRSQGALFEAVLRQMPAGLLIAEAPSGRLVFSNDEVERIWAGSPGAVADVAGYAAYRGFRDDGSELRPQDWPLARAIAAGEVVEGEVIRFERFDGSRGVMEVRATPVRDPDGAIVAGVVTFSDVTARTRAEERLRFLAEASALLGASLDYETTLADVARLAATGVADWCSVSIREDDGSIRQLAVAHRDPEQVRRAEDSRRRPVDPDGASGAARVILTGEPRLLREVTPELLEEALREQPELRDVLSRLPIRSVMVVPLSTRDRVFGALTFVASESSFDDHDLLLATELGRRAGVAIENARLFAATQQTAAILDAQNETVVDGLLLVSPEGRMLSHNGRFAEIWGIPEHVLAGGSDEAALEIATARVADPEAFRSRVRYLYEHPDEDSRDEVRLADGSVLDRYGCAVRGADGTYYGYLWSFRDVTEERRAEEALVGAQARLGLLADVSLALSESLDYRRNLGAVAELVVPSAADWCSVSVLEEDGSIEVVAWTHSDPERRRWADEMRRRRRVRLDDDTPTARVIRTGEPELMELTAETVAAARPEDRELVRAMGIRSLLAVPFGSARGTSGSIMFVSAESGRVFDDDDLLLAREIARRVGVAVENARLYAETEARAQAAEALEFVGEGVLLVGTDGLVRLWNPQAQAVTGLAEAAVVGRPVAEAIPGWDELVARVPVVEAADAARSRSEIVPLDVGGRELWLSMSGVSFDAGTVFAFRDVSEERGLERMKSDFVSTVSHELRTPLAAIYGAALTLRRADLPLPEEQRQELLGVVADEADRLARIVNDILWTSRIESGAMQVQIESCDPAELATGVVHAARLHIPERVELALEVPPALPRVAADRDKVRQVLANLVDNAAKYAPDGDRIELRVEPATRTVRFLVSDEGLGIPAGERDRVFEKFYRLDPDLNRGVGGTGLGLYICRELVRRMEGRIWVESREPRGSTFVVELPAV
jgi:PAS domain S-box-containing protein